MSEEEEFLRKLEVLKGATDEHPNDGLAWAALGDFLEAESENPTLAIRAYERAQELLPNKDLRLRLGNAYVLKGEIERGIAMLLASAADRPRAEAYCFLAEAYLRNGRKREAEGAARTAIRLEPTFEEGYFLLGESIKDADPLAALDAYRAAAALDNNYALAWQAIGRELIHTGNTEDGVDALTRAVALDPDDVWSRIFLANGLSLIGRPKEAEEQYLAAIRLAPEFSDLKRWYQEFLERR